MSSGLSFRYYKSQEIPLFYYEASSNIFNDIPTAKQMIKDYVDIKFSLIDNGDNKVCCEIQIGHRKQINIICDMYLPSIDDEPLKRMMVGGSGNTTIIKDISAKMVQR